MIVELRGKSFEVADEPADFWGWVKKGNYNQDFWRLERHLRPEHTFIDLGAWIGSHSLYASTIAHRVIAIEPDPVAFQILTVNTNSTPIESRRIAITNHVGRVKLGSALLGASTTRVNPLAGGLIGPWDDKETFEIECTTLRQFCADISDPLFIKMDVEGSEEQILQDTAFFTEREVTLLLEQHPFWWGDVPHTREFIELVNPIS